MRERECVRVYERERQKIRVGCVEIISRDDEEARSEKRPNSQEIPIKKSAGRSYNNQMYPHSLSLLAAREKVLCGLWIIMPLGRQRFDKQNLKKRIFNV